jgi:hypothetical protein
MNTRTANKVAMALLSLSTFTTFHVAQLSTVLAQSSAFTYPCKPPPPAPRRSAIIAMRSA